jgi:hypothetical protein
MTFNFSWEDMGRRGWLTVLSLPTLSWATPFLPLLRLPDSLLQKMDVWEEIYTNAFSEYQVKDKAKDLISIGHAARGELLRCTVIQILQQIAGQIGCEAASVLEQWVWFHCFDHEAEIALNTWRIALTNLYLLPGSRQFSKKVEPPACLIPLLPRIYELVNNERWEGIYQAIRLAAPPPAYEQIPYEKLEKCYESTLLWGYVQQALMAEALETIAKHLNESERFEVVRWAEIQIRTRHPRYGHPEHLYADKYLKPKLICSEAPSLLHC